MATERLHWRDDPKLAPAREYLYALLEQKFTKIPKRAIRKLENADVATLQRWNWRVPVCDNIMDVFD